MKNCVRAISILAAISVSCSLVGAEVKEDSNLQNVQSFKHVLNMKNWLPPDVEYAISDEGSDVLQRNLLNYLEIRFVNNLKPLMATGNDLLAAFSAYYWIYLNAAWHASWSVTFDVATKNACDAASRPDHEGSSLAAFDDAKLAAHNASSKTSWKHGEVAIKKAMRNAAFESNWNSAKQKNWDGITDTARCAAWNTAVRVLTEAATLAMAEHLKILPIKDLAMVSRNTYRLAALHNLAFIALDDYFNIFMKSYLAAKERIEEEKFLKSQGQISFNISVFTGHRDPSLAQNPYIISSKNIIKELSQKLEQNAPKDVQKEEKVDRSLAEIPSLAASEFDIGEFFRKMLEPAKNLP